VIFIPPVLWQTGQDTKCNIRCKIKSGYFLILILAVIPAKIKEKRRILRISCKNNSKNEIFLAEKGVRQKKLVGLS